MSQTGLRARFERDGFVVVRRLLPKARVRQYLRLLETLAGEHRVERNQSLPEGSGVRGAWTLPDGVTRNAALWEVIDAPYVIEPVREVLGGDVRFLQHTDLHVGFSAVSWHRDSVNRAFGRGPEWEGTGAADYRLARVGFYLQSYAESGFRLGLVPGSHRPAEGAEAERQRRLDRMASWPGQVRSWLGRRSPLAAEATWVAAESGDAVLFDPRILHAGSTVSGPKYSIFVAYGRPNAHFARHRDYYGILRPDLGYRELPDDLARRLRAKGLLAPTFAPVDLTHAYRPPRWLGSLAKHFGVRA